ncbi:MAG TPA: rRNA maturation RNase YbeY [Leucothrix sp.]|nr:rRNA maturation RNase YbeY [Leucothrix sp.]
MIELDVQNPYEYKSIPNANELSAWVDAAIQGHNLSHSLDHKLSIVIRFVNVEEGKALNQAYRYKKYATNVLSFPFEEPEFTTDITELNEVISKHLQQQHLGDIVLCEEIVQKEAAEQNKTLKQHWAHLIVHGVLHLQGYDHLNDEDASLMESLEIKILKILGFDNPYS